jgi:hypothetical protein
MQCWKHWAVQPAVVGLGEAGVVANVHSMAEAGVAAGVAELATPQQQALSQGKLRLACSNSKYSNKHSRACSQQMHTSQQQQQQQLSLLVVRRLPRGNVQMVKARRSTREQPGCPVVQNRQEQLQQQQHLVSPPQQLLMLQLLQVNVET